MYTLQAAPTHVASRLELRGPQKCALKESLGLNGGYCTLAGRSKNGFIGFYRISGRSGCRASADPEIENRTNLISLYPTP